ncbi:MAG TPA: phosphoribosylformylglycinamidine synthase subunit PurS, partial [Terriglobales bacterium]|nr:phosphoribosylformylglycinamidine synthase subunit PurS [Terriglobales bacterium]
NSGSVDAPYMAATPASGKVERGFEAIGEGAAHKARFHGQKYIESGRVLLYTSISPEILFTQACARASQFGMCRSRIRGVSTPVRPLYNFSRMKAYVYVSLKKTVLDPQGKTIHGALAKMGYQGVGDVRQGKYFEISLDNRLDREKAQAEVDRIAREVLTNPVIEEYRYSIEE